MIPESGTIEYIYIGIYNNISLVNIKFHMFRLIKKPFFYTLINNTTQHYTAPYLIQKENGIPKGKHCKLTFCAVRWTCRIGPLECVSGFSELTLHLYGNQDDNFFGQPINLVCRRVYCTLQHTHTRFVKPPFRVFGLGKHKTDILHDHNLRKEPKSKCLRENGNISVQIFDSKSFV